MFPVETDRSALPTFTAPIVIFPVEEDIFIFPERWENNVKVERDPINDEIVFRSYKGGSEGRELLRIYLAEDQPSREDRLANGYMLLHTKGDSAYLAYIPSAPDTEGDGLTPAAGDVAVGFHFKE